VRDAPEGRAPFSISEFGGKLFHAGGWRRHAGKVLFERETAEKNVTELPENHSRPTGARWRFVRIGSTIRKYGRQHFDGTMRQRHGAMAITAWPGIRAVGSSQHAGGRLAFGRRTNPRISRPPEVGCCATQVAQSLPPLPEANAPTNVSRSQR